jgi:hypothetical protein
LKKQLVEVNAKLDRLIGVVEKFLEAKGDAKKEVKEKPLVETKAAKKTTLKNIVKKALKK